MKRRAQGWWWRGIGTAALLAIPVLPMLGVGWVLGHVSDLVGIVTARPR